MRRQFCKQFLRHRPLRKSPTIPPTSPASRKRPFAREGRSRWFGGDGNARRRDPAFDDGFRTGASALAR